MSQLQVEAQPEVSTNKASRLLLRILAGPFGFLVVQSLPLAGLNPKAHVALSCYVWVLAWWATTPIPWAVTGFLPLVLFPVVGAMPFAETIGLYGQRILPFLLGVMLFGHAFYKHGLAKRMAMAVLSIPGVATSGARLVLMIMVVSALVSAVVDDAATVAIMIPIALSVAKFAAEAYAKTSNAAGSNTPRLTQASCLAVLYGALSGVSGAASTGSDTVNAVAKAAFSDSVVSQLSSGLPSTASSSIRRSIASRGGTDRR